MDKMMQTVKIDSSRAHNEFKMNVQNLYDDVKSMLNRIIRIQDEVEKHKVSN